MRLLVIFAAVVFLFYLPGNAEASSITAMSAYQAPNSDSQPQPEPRPDRPMVATTLEEEERHRLRRRLQPERMGRERL